MRILFLNRSYYPDVEATGQFLAELCADLAKAHDVTVIAGRPNFVASTGAKELVHNERHEGVAILRVRNVRFRKRSLLGRALGLASYLGLAVSAALRVRRPDVIVVETDPPLLGAVGALLRRWHRCGLVFYLQDLFPEIALRLGKLRPGLLTRGLHAATQLGLRAADRVVVLGEDMRLQVLRRGIEPAKIVVVPNWADTAVLRPVPATKLRREWGLRGQFVVMYSGNIGLSQNLDQILTVARQLREESVRFLFVGEGAAKEQLQEQAHRWGLTNVRFLPYQPKERLAESLGAADLHLIPMQRGLAGCMVPSKLYGILAVGVPYVAAVDRASEVARVTQAGQCGLLIEPDRPEQMAETIRWCLTHPQELAAMGRRGRALAEQHFDRRQAVARFQAVLESVGGSTPSCGQAALAAMPC